MSVAECKCQCCKHHSAKCEHGFTQGHKWAYEEKGPGMSGGAVPYWCSGPKQPRK